MATAVGTRKGADQWGAGTWIGPTLTKGLFSGKMRGGTERKLAELPTEGMAGPSTLIGPLAERGAHPPETEQALCVAGLCLSLKDLTYNWRATTKGYPYKIFSK